MSKEKFKKFIKKAGAIFPEILDVGGKLITGNISGAITEIKDVLKSKNEDVKAKDLLIELHEIEMEKNINERWSLDAKSDSWLAKNVRPLSLVYMFVIVTVISILDSWVKTFIIKEAWIDLFSTLLVTMVIAYFGSRGFEKTKDIFK